MAGCLAHQDGGRVSSLASRQQMLAQQLGPMFSEQFLEDLLVGQSLVDLFCKGLAHYVRHAAAVGVATGERVKVSGAIVALDAAGAVDTGQEPVDALSLAA